MEQHTDTAPLLTDSATPSVWELRRRHGRPGPKSDLEHLQRGNRRTWARGRLVAPPDALYELDVPAYLMTDPPLDPATFADTDDDDDHSFVFRKATLPPVYRPDGSVVDVDPDDPRAYVQARVASFADPTQRVGRTVVFHRGGALTVSTIFTGWDMNAGRSGPPVLWETAVYDSDGEQRYGRRYASRAAALHGHRLITATIRAAWAADRPGAPIRARRPR